MKNYIKVYVSYTDTSGSDRAKWRKYSVVTIYDNSWHQLCTNIHDLVSNDKSLLINTRFKTYVEFISLDYWGVDFYVDDIFIWRDAVRGEIHYSLKCQNAIPLIYKSYNPMFCSSQLG